MSQPQPTTHSPPACCPAEAARRARLRRRRRIIGYAILAILIVPPLADVLSDPYGEVADWYYAAALENYASGKPDLAEEYFAKSLEWSPRTEPRIHAARARYFMSKENYEDAVAEINRSMETIGATISLLMLRAECYQRMNEPESAVADWTAIMQIGMQPTLLDRLMPQWHIDRKAELLNAVAYAKAVGNVKLQDGLRQVEESLELIPANDLPHRAMALDTRGFLHYRLGNHPAALRDTDEAVDILEGLLQEHAEKLLQDERNEAIRNRRYKALRDEVNKGLVVILYHRALAHEALGQSAAAQADFDRVRAITGREPGEWLF